MEKIDGSQFVRRTKQWTPTVYRVGRTGESPRIFQLNSDLSGAFLFGGDAI